ncbi:cysteine-rich venom protein-like [Culicoides brevitarsis]|uniref:cysteine-rich venom protein-like n=1 Tax=Culicoides brevitarsis TaxID=469753 RepID=UPI00307C2531
MGKTLFIIIIILTTAITYSSTWKRDRRPRIYGDRIQNRHISPRMRRVQNRIIMLHDYFRTKVRPKAANMLRMNWHHGAARAAQRWADQCLLLQHDTPKGRWVDNFGSCGQNIFVSTQKVSWLFAMQTWFIERHNFTYGSNRNHLHVVGHYTQMVNAATHKVGCGLTRCKSGGPRGKPFYNYVCNYCPIGNHPDRLGTPYMRGKPCSACPHACLSRDIRLCTNECNAADKLSNCKELYQRFPGWLCNEVTKEGLERHDNCKATCTCRGRIHDFN